MGTVIHKTVPVKVWADVDEGIAAAVIQLNEIPGIRTYASCQGTTGERGPEPYGPYVMFSWRDAEALDRVRLEFDVTFGVGGENSNMASAHPRLTE